MIDTMLPLLMCAVTLGLSILTRVEALCTVRPYLTRYKTAAARGSDVINYLSTDSSRECCGTSHGAAVAFDL